MIKNNVRKKITLIITLGVFALQCFPLAVIGATDSSIAPLLKINASVIDSLEKRLNELRGISLANHVSIKSIYSTDAPVKLNWDLGVRLFNTAKEHLIEDLKGLGKTTQKNSGQPQKTPQLNLNYSWLPAGPSIKKLASPELKSDGYYVMNKKDNSILLVSTTRQDFSATGGVNEFYDAIWLSNVPGNIDIGQKVQFEVDGVVLQSYPGQAQAKNVSVLTVPKPEKAKLTTEEALKRALLSDQVEENGVMVLKSIRFNVQSAEWQINIKDTIFEQEYNLTVDDQ
jgi:hypothetical protein